MSEADWKARAMRAEQRLQAVRLACIEAQTRATMAEVEAEWMRAIIKKVEIVTRVGTNSVAYVQLLDLLENPKTNGASLVRAILAELIALVNSGYDGPFIGHAVAPLMRAIAKFEKEF